ncbi:MAG TPA: hypothetical protein VMC84_01130 [Methanocella sp.]|uniref:hypothetical protein n=1 Tax=Methanocella sp. TaxID=2052833 RepID=UPI002BBF207B|nr:hypothetical protein [Methanocella sp.]HTY89757.1 hypothetical protein [Methanocella sp.]
MHKPDCPCPKSKCERHGYCDECRQYHGLRSGLPYCERPKRTLASRIRQILHIP